MSDINMDLARPAWKQGSALASYRDLVALEAVLCGIHGRTDGRDKRMSFQPPWSCQPVISPTARRLRPVAMPTGCYLSDASHWLAKLVRTGAVGGRRTGYRRLWPCREGIPIHHCWLCISVCRDANSSADSADAWPTRRSKDGRSYSVLTNSCNLCLTASSPNAY